VASGGASATTCAGTCGSVTLQNNSVVSDTTLDNCHGTIGGTGCD
jgi:hypothetical protein